MMADEEDRGSPEVCTLRLGTEDDAAGDGELLECGEPLDSAGYVLYR